MIGERQGTKFSKFRCLSWPYHIFPCLLFGCSLCWSIMWKFLLWGFVRVQKIVWSIIFCWWTEVPDWIYWCGVHYLDYCCQLWLGVLFRLEYCWASIVPPDKFRRKLNKKDGSIPGSGAYPAKLLVLSAPMLSLWFMNLVGLYGLEHIRNGIYTFCLEHAMFRGMHPVAVFLSKPRKPPDGVISSLLVLLLVVMFYIRMIFRGICVIWKYSIFNPSNMLMNLRKATTSVHSWLHGRSHQFQGGG